MAGSATTSIGHIHVDVGGGQAVATARTTSPVAAACVTSPDITRLSATRLTRTSPCPGRPETAGLITSTMRSSWLAANAAQVANTSSSVARLGSDPRIRLAPSSRSVQAVAGVPEASSMVPRT
jgi:hypothetical protein